MISYHHIILSFFGLSFVYLRIVKHTVSYTRSLKQTIFMMCWNWLKPKHHKYNAHKTSLVCMVFCFGFYFIMNYICLIWFCWSKFQITLVVWHRSKHRLAEGRDEKLKKATKAKEEVEKVKSGQKKLFSHEFVNISSSHPYNRSLE